MAEDPVLFKCREQFLTRATERLGVYPSNFQSAMEQIKASVRTIAPHQAAGVLLPLYFRTSPADTHSEGQFVFQLIKRSSRVSQPGDLSCPGGMVHPILDRLLRPLLLHGHFSIVRGPARIYALHREPAIRKIMTLFLANALREAWEEIGLAPYRVRFLGPIPTYSLTLFRRTIFPLVGFVERPGSLHLNREVEKIVEIPLASFYREDLIGCHTFSLAEPTYSGRHKSFQYPCLIHCDPDGGEEILWGATFHILTQFLWIVMDYHLPDWKKGRIVQRTLRSDYLTGRSS
jgi:8-oxo-dGTP pyrophosphatase MutT (NUDIX family)